MTAGRPTGDPHSPAEMLGWDQRLVLGVVWVAGGCVLFLLLAPPELGVWLVPWFPHMEDFESTAGPAAADYRGYAFGVMGWLVALFWQRQWRGNSPNAADDPLLPTGIALGPHVERALKLVVRGGVFGAVIATAVGLYGCMTSVTGLVIGVVVAALVSFAAMQGRKVALRRQPPRTFTVLLIGSVSFVFYILGTVAIDVYVALSGRAHLMLPP